MADTCPITQRHKSELDIPVLNIVDNQYYEYAPIMLWLESNGTSPITRQPCEPCDLVALNDIWLVIDKSGSMSANATSHHMKEQSNLCIMDLVCYSCIALLKSLKACKPNQCTFGAIFYDSEVTYTFHRQLLTNASIASFEEAMRTHAKPAGLTNWTDPLIDVLQQVSPQNTDIIFFTDGLPNVAVDCVQSSVSAHVKADNNLVLHAVAFGYGGIDCSLLRDLTDTVKSRQSKEHYGRISGGLYFIASVTDVMNAMLTLAVSIAVDPSPERKQQRLTSQCSPERSHFMNLLDNIIQVTKPHSSRFSSALSTTDAQLTDAQHLVAQYQTFYAAFFEQDITGAVSDLKSFSNWGRPFIHALLDAHQSMQTRNKYDTTCLSYTALHTDWDTTYKIVSDVFESLPMPTSIIHPRTTQRACAPVNLCNGPPPTMASQYMTCSGCISGDTMVMTNNGWKPANTLKKGMHVAIATESLTNINIDTKPYITAEIDIVMQTTVEQGCDMVVVDGAVIITPYHPIRLGFGAPWQFPEDLSRHESNHTTAKTTSKIVYTFALKPAQNETTPAKRAPNILAQGNTQTILVATLAHGLEGNVIGHEYFGTEQVIYDLHAFEEIDGKVNLVPDNFKRDGQTGNICGIAKN